MAAVLIATVTSPRLTSRPGAIARAPIMDWSKLIPCLAALALSCSSGVDGGPSGGPGSGSGHGSSDGSSLGPRVVCTTAMIGDLALEIGGDAAEVEVLFGSDMDPHLFRPTRDDVKLLMAADIVLYNGLHLEGYLVEALGRVEDSGVEVIPVAERVLLDGELLVSGQAPDPHVWMDASVWSRVPGLIAGALGQASPANQRTFTERAAVVEARLIAADEQYRDAFASLAPDRRVLLTAHDAFGYFGRRYGLEVHGIQGVSTTSEASLNAIEELVHLVVERQIPAVFFESTVSERNVRALVEGARARGQDLQVGGVLHADAPGQAGTFEQMLRSNVSTILGALGTDDDAGAQEVAR